MDYDKKYKEALERAKRCHKYLSNLDGAVATMSKDFFEEVFSELKESEDEWLEKIRKELKDYLEKRPLKKISESDAVNQWIDWLEKQGEQKPVDKIERKFKVGDWIIRSAEGFKHNTYLVTDVKYYYVCEDLKGGRVTFTFNDVHKNFKMWDISDARDGDVLAIDWHEGGDCWEKIIIFKKYHEKGVEGLFYGPCVEGYGNTIKNEELAWNDENVPYYSQTWTSILRPATKEQRDLLFTKMKEAGYEWDAEKKELRKIEQKPIDKVEPKFKIEKGKWYVCTRGLYDNYANKAFRKGDRYLSTQNGSLIPSNSNVPFEVVCSDVYFRDWTIQDAKDGDVLVTEIDGEPNDFIYVFREYDQNLGFWSHCYLDAYINKFHKGIYHNNYNVGVPATKEQRDLLFTKMKEAGYEWDAEKKELRKIE